MDEPRDPRLDLPGSASPPVEGSRWFWIKIGAWVLAVGLIVAVSAVVSLVLGRMLQGAGDVAATWRDRATEARRDAASYDEPPPPNADAGASTSTVGLNGEIVRAPGWARQPTPDFPQAALRAGVEAGEVELRCAGRVSGRVEACEILSETPLGYGFGQSALAAAHEARLAPRTVDGVATEGSLRFTIRYRTGPEPRIRERG